MAMDASETPAEPASYLESPHLLSPCRWLWASSRVEKMKGGVTRGLSALSWSDQWSERLLILPAHTGCLHWFRDDGDTLITTLGIERGCIRLVDIRDVQVEAADCEIEDQSVLVLLSDYSHRGLRFRASAETIASWKEAIEHAREYVQRQGHNFQHSQSGFWSAGLPGVHVIDDLPETCPIRVDDKLKFDDLRIRSMGFAMQMPDANSTSTVTCSGTSGLFPRGPRPRLLLVFGDELRWFEPKDGSMFGSRKGSCNLKTIKSVSMHQSRAEIVKLKTSKGTILMKTRHSALWVSFLSGCISDCLSSPSSTLDDDHASAASSPDNSAVTPTSRDVRRTAGLAILFWNSSVFLALLLWGTKFFWPLIATINAAILYVCVKSDQSLPRENIENGKEEAVIHDHLLSSKFLEKGPEYGCVEDCKGTEVQVRGPDYIRDSQKQPSQPSFYELVRVQVMAPTGSKREHVSEDVAVLEEEMWPELAGALPAFFVLNVQLPEDEPKWLSKPSSNSTSVVFYFRVRPETQQSASAGEESADGALRLLLAYCNRADKDNSLKEKLKVICHIGNPEACGVPKSLLKFNSKPSMVRKAGTLFRGPGHLEMDVDLSGCPFPHRQMFHQMRSKINQMELQLAVVIQGDAADELPERVWACVRLHGIDLDVQASSSGGNSPRTSYPQPLSRESSDSAEGLRRRIF